MLLMCLELLVSVAWCKWRTSVKEYVRPCPGSSNDNKVDRLTNIPTKRPLARYIQNNAYPYEPEVAHKYLLYDGSNVTIDSAHLMNTLIAFKAQQDNDF